MAKPTIKGLQEQLDLYKETIDLVTKDNTRLYKELENTKANKDVVSKEEYDALVNEIELLKLQVKEYKGLYENERQKEKIKRVKNSRNAGRKPIENRLKYKVLELKNEQKLSIRAIAKELNISIGSVHKIISEHKQE